MGTSIRPPTGDAMTRPSTERMKRAAIYLKAAERIETFESCGCCDALINSQGSAEERIFSALFKPRGRHGMEYWMGPCVCDSDENVGFRVLAMCFMAAMAEAGDV